jgi:hypothetical protein
MAPAANPFLSSYSKERFAMFNSENKRYHWLVRVLTGLGCLIYVYTVARLAGASAAPQFAIPVTLLAVLVSYVVYSDVATGKWSARYAAWRPRLVARSVVVLTAVALVLTMSVVSASAGTQGIGGPSGGFDYGDNHRVGIGSNWAEVWHNGYYPFGGFLNYQIHLKISWSFSHKGLYSIDARPRVEISTDKERFIEFDPRTDIIAQKGYFTDCVVEGKVRKRGCYFASIKAKVVITTPMRVKIMTAYPWLSIKVNGRGEVVVPNWSPGKV